MEKKEKSILEKSIIMCYRGSDKSNRISSATKNYLEKYQSKSKLDIEYINIDKRNLNKFVNSILNREIPLDIIYVYYDEEFLLELLSENCPDLDVRIYSLDTAKKDKWETQKGVYNGIGEDLINEYKYSLGSYTFWIAVDNKPKKIIISKYDYERSALKSRYHRTEYGCYKTILKDYEYRVKRNKSDIEMYERMIATAKANIDKYENSIKELENILNNYDYLSTEVEAEKITDLEFFEGCLN